MRSYTHYRRFSILLVPLLALTLLLAACANGGGQTVATLGGSSVRVTHKSGNEQEITVALASPTATPKPKPTPTSATGSTASSGGPSTPTGFKTYQGSYLGVAFSIAYPPDWSISPNATDHATFINGSAGSFAVQVSLKSYTPSQTVQMGIANTRQGASSSQPVSMPPTTTINGVTWSQGGVITYGKSGGPLELVIMATRTSHLIILMYDGSPQGFDTLVQNVYQPMVQSFSMS